MNTANEEYLTGMAIQGVAQVLGVTYDVAWRLVRFHELEAVRVGNTWLVNPDSVRTYKEKMKAKEAKSPL